MRRPGIEPGARRWQRRILPLNQQRASMFREREDWVYIPNYAQRIERGLSGPDFASPNGVCVSLFFY